MRIDPAYQRKERITRIVTALIILVVVIGIAALAYRMVTGAGTCQATYIRGNDKNATSREESCA